MVRAPLGAMRGIAGRLAVAGALAASGLALLAPPASAGAHTVTYAALGDSYSAGVGTPNPDPAVPACDRTPYAWPYRVGAALGWSTVDLACSGATTQDIVRSFGGQPAQTALLSALRPRPRVVSITVGGNDVGFTPVLGACLDPRNPAGACLAAVAAADLAILTVLPPRLFSTYRAVERADPRARLVVVGYPRLFPSSTADIPGCPVSTADRLALTEAANLLNGVIAVQAWLAGATYVDVSSSLSGHEFCTADPWLVLPPQAGAGHPTIAGQDAIAAVVTRALAHLRLTPSRPRVANAAG